MKTVYARKTTVDKIENSVAQEFIDENHSQGASNESIKKETLGLFLNDELLAVAQFCSPRTAAKKRKYSTELLRLCFKKDYRITGGASKLIKSYISRYKPSDIFTYQDTTGENTNVYEKCGFKLVSTAKEKTYLIAPNKTLKTADRKKKEIITIAYAVKLGPDAIIGTKLGEVYHKETHPTKSNKRKTNIELFEELGWSQEKTTGDKTYEWFDKSRTYYTYKITATDSDKYYYGVSHVKIQNATINECLKDGYFGSGGNTVINNKFKNWKKKHKDTLHKEIVQIFEYRGEAYESEKQLIGELWETDKKCLNSTAGGTYTGFNKGWRENVTEQECPTHGLTKHRGKACYKCFMNKLVKEQNCDIHGLTKFQGESCSKCAVAKTFTKQECPIHGLVTFSGKNCRTCSNQKSVTMKDCPVHGLTKHQGIVCNSCNALKSIQLKNCIKHGETKFTGTKCRKCISEKNNVEKDCPVHGKSMHRGKSCVKCISQRSTHKKKHNVIKDTECFICTSEETSINALLVK